MFSLTKKYYDDRGIRSYYHDYKSWCKVYKSIEEMLDHCIQYKFDHNDITFTFNNNIKCKISLRNEEKNITLKEVFFSYDSR